MTGPAGPGDGADPAQVAAELRLVVGRVVRRLRSRQSDGPTASQLSALAQLADHGQLRLRDLSAAEGVSPPTASKVVDALAGRGLVSRSADPDDARGTRVTITDSGVRLLEEGRSGREAALTDALTRLPPGEVARIAAALPALRALLDRL